MIINIVEQLYSVIVPPEELSLEESISLKEIEVTGVFDTRNIILNTQGNLVTCELDIYNGTEETFKKIEVSIKENQEHYGDAKIEKKKGKWSFKILKQKINVKLSPQTR